MNNLNNSAFSASLCAGIGQFHTNEPDKEHRKPYVEINIEKIRELVDNPQERDKSKAQWLIASSLLSRNFKEQEENGNFWLLWADLDTDPLPIHIVKKHLVSIIGACQFEIYTSRSATEENQKARVLIILAESLNGADWKLCQEILNDSLSALGVTPDRASERTAQLCYLPNKGDYYNSLNNRDGELFAPMVRFKKAIEQKKLAIVLATHDAKKRRAQAEERRAALKCSGNKTSDLIGAFNEAYTVEDILIQAGYKQRGNTFCHPNSESGSYAATVKDGRVHSLNGTDPLNTGEGAHDAFSAFCVLFHDSDNNKALKNAGDQWLEINGESWNKVVQREHMKSQKVSTKSTNSTESKKPSTINTINTDGGCRGYLSAPLSALSSTLPEKEGKKQDKKDSILAKELSIKLKNTLIYDEISSDWYCSNNGVWNEATKTRALIIIDKVLAEVVPTGFAINKLNNMEAFLKLYLVLDRWDINNGLIPLNNGVLNTKTKKLSNYSPASRFRYQLPYSYIPAAKLDVIKTWLTDSTGGDKQVLAIIRAFFNTALMVGSCQKFLEVVGKGGTGKSTLVRLLIKLIGEANHAATDLENLEKNRFEAASLYGKQLAVISDSGRYGGEVSVLKSITGGDPVRLEKKNQQQSGSFVFKGAVIIACNEPIQSTDYTSGLARRRLPIMFNKKITTADKEKWQSVGGIEAAMNKELPALLNWVLSMPKNEVDSVINGISDDLTVAERTHLCETNKLAAWLDSNIVLREGNIIFSGGSVKDSYPSANEERATKLYPNYEQWCAENKVQSIGVQRFTNNLIDICEHIKLPVKKLQRSNKGIRVQGLKIRSELDRDITIITLQNLFSVDECCNSVDKYAPQSLGSVDGVNSVDKTRFSEKQDKRKYEHTQAMAKIIPDAPLQNIPTDEVAENEGVF